MKGFGKNKKINSGSAYKTQLKKGGEKKSRKENTRKLQRE